MRRVREAVFLGIGVLAGLALSGPAAQAVDYLQARPSNQAVYVDGQKVEMEAYFIHDNNFVMLRDIGEAVGFNVYWDGRSVQVESDKPYTGVAPDSTQPPAALTEEGVQTAYTGPAGYLSHWYRLWRSLPLHQQRPIWGVQQQLRGLGNPMLRYSIR